MCGEVVEEYEVDWSAPCPTAVWEAELPSSIELQGPDEEMLNECEEAPSSIAMSECVSDKIESEWLGPSSIAVPAGPLLEPDTGAIVESLSCIELQAKGKRNRRQRKKEATMLAGGSSPPAFKMSGKQRKRPDTESGGKVVAVSKNGGCSGVPGGGAVVHVGKGGGKIRGGESGGGVASISTQRWWRWLC